MSAVLNKKAGSCQKIVSSLSALFLIALLGLAVNLWWVGPHLGMGIYNGIRMFTVFGLSIACARLWDRKRFDIVRLATFLIFLEQIALKAIWMWQQARHDPGAWMDVTPGVALLTLGMGYIVFFPFIFLVAFAGAELGRHLRQKTARKSA
jgi:hypothetical protein